MVCISYPSEGLRVMCRVYCVHRKNIHRKQVYKKCISQKCLQLIGILSIGKGTDGEMSCCHLSSIYLVVSDPEVDGSVAPLVDAGAAELCHPFDEEPLQVLRGLHVLGALELDGRLQVEGATLRRHDERLLVRNASPVTK